MKQQSNFITIFQFSLLIMTAIGFKNHVLIIPTLIQTGGRDAWLSVILIFFVALAWVPLLIYIQNKTHQEHIFLWIKKHVGKTASYLILFITSAYLVILSVVTLKDTILWTKVSYLPETPTISLTLLLAILCFYLAFSGLRTISIVNIFLIFAVIILGFFVGISNIQFKNYSLLRPFLEHGFEPVRKAMIYPASGIIELIIFTFLQHRINQPIRFKHLVINLLLLVGLTIGPLIGAIIEFGPAQAARQRYPAFEEWSLVRLTRYIEHVDFLSIYQWLTGAFIRISVLLFIIIEITQLKTKRQRFWLLFTLFVIVIGLTLIGISDMQFYKLLKEVFLPTTFYLLFSISLLLGFLVFLFHKKARR